MTKQTSHTEKFRLTTDDELALILEEGEGYTLDETLLASQLLAFCEGMLSRFVRSEFKYRPTDDFDARWPLVAAQLQ